MKVAVTSSGRSLDSAMDPRFGRCACFVVVETDDMSFVAVDNGAASLGGGAGIQSARVVAEQGATVVLTGNVGPNAHQALSAAGIQIITGASGTVAEAIGRFRAGGMKTADGPTVASHSGMGGQG
jgi:predicted Fe-Mo cluster-binding NifX family protein